MNFHKYPDVKPENNQQIVIIQHGVYIFVDIFKNGLDDWCDETYDRFEDGTNLTNTKFFWMDYKEFWKNIR